MEQKTLAFAAMVIVITLIGFSNLSLAQVKPLSLQATWVQKMTVLYAKGGQPCRER